ncbi:MAG: hypothetical protein WDZ94_01105 [Patescibacteria group bacterium]
MFGYTISANSAGQLLVEVLVIMGILAVILPALLGSLIVSRQGEPQRQNRLAATFLLREAVDILRLIREDSWLAVQEPGTYQLVEAGTTWTLEPGVESLDQFERRIVIEPVFRDESGEIAPAGSEDFSTRLVTVQVSWEEPYPGEVSSELYLTRYLDNITFIDDEELDFEQGELLGTAVTNSAGGEVILGSGGHGDWCEPEDHIIAEMNLPQSGLARSVAAIEGTAFTGTDTFFSGSFFEIAITNEDPPDFTIANDLPGYSTNDVFIDGDYAYVAVDDPFDWYERDVVIISLTTNEIVGYFDTSGWVGGSGVYVRGNVGYVTTGNYVRTFDLSEKTGARPQLDSQRIETSFLADWFARGRKIRVVGDYAYVALSGWSSNEMRLINVANSSNLSRGARANVNGENGQELFVNETGTRAYLATDHSSSLDEFFVINTDYSTAQKNSTSFDLQVISSYNSQGMSPQGVIAVPGNRAILVGTGGEEYQVLDISNENNMVRCGGMQIESGIYGVAAVLEEDGDAFSYIVTEDSSNEFKAILGGPGGQFIDEGIFESRIFDAGHATAFNYSIADFVRPANTAASYQIGVANPDDGNCATADYQYVGADGTSNTFYADEGPIFWGSTGGDYMNPGKCFKYRVYFDTDDSGATPILQSMTINYSP